MEKHFCIQCKHHFYGTADKKDIWYNHFCDVEPQHIQDYVTGAVDVRFEYCRDRNRDGRCINFEEGNSTRYLNQ